MKKTVKEQIFNFLRENTGSYHGGALQRMNFYTRKDGLATGDNIKRRLNELVEEGKITVDYKGGQAYFSIQPQHRKIRQVVRELPNGNVRVEYIPV